MPKSLIEYAYEFMQNQEVKASVSFKDLWDYVISQANLTAEEAESKVSRFYTNLMLDGRFIILGDNIWDLRERHTFDKFHIDMGEVYSDVEAEDNDEEEDEEDKEYKEVFEEPQTLEPGDEIEPDVGADDEEEL